MSRIGRKPVTLLKGVTIEQKENNTLVVKGPKGTLTKQFDSSMNIKVEL